MDDDVASQFDFCSKKPKAFGKRLRSDPLGTAKGLRLKFREVDDGYRPELYFLIAGACVFATILRKDDKLCQSFFDDPFFEGKKVPGGNRILLRVMCYVLTVRGKGSAYDRAQRYSKAVEKHFMAGSALDLIRDELQVKGIEKMRIEAEGRNETISQISDPMPQPSGHVTKPEKATAPPPLPKAITPTVVQSGKSRAENAARDGRLVAFQVEGEVADLLLAMPTGGEGCLHVMNHSDAEDVRVLRLTGFVPLEIHPKAK